MWDDTSQLRRPRLNICCYKFTWGGRGGSNQVGLHKFKAETSQRAYFPFILPDSAGQNL